MADIRLNINFRKHPKVKRLIRQDGEGAGLALITLWCYTADLFPRGILTGMDQDDIEDAAEWSGERGALLTGLLNHGLLDKAGDGTYSIHDWKDHQNFVYHSPERKEQSQRANEKRWQSKRGVNPDRTPDRNADKDSHQESPSSSSSSSSSSQKDQKIVSVTRPKGNGRFTIPTLEEVSEHVKSRGGRIDPIKFHAHYTSNGWKVGKNSMKSWRAAVVTWERSANQ